MTFLLWLLFTALAVGIPPGFIARKDGSGMLAGNEREKSKKGPLALASERRAA